MLASVYQIQKTATDGFSNYILFVKNGDTNEMPSGELLQRQVRAIRTEMATLTGQVSRIQGERQAAASVADKFKDLEEQLRQIRQDLEGVRKEIDKTKSHIGSL